MQCPLQTKGNNVSGKPCHKLMNIGNPFCNYVFPWQGVFQRKYSVNEALLSAGLGVMVETERFRELNKQTQFITGLGKSEREAQRRGAGVWQGSPQVVWWRRGIQAVKKLLGKT